MHRYRLYDLDYEDLGVLDHPSPDLGPDAVVEVGGALAVVVGRVDGAPGSVIAAMLQVAVLDRSSAN